MLREIGKSLFVVSILLYFELFPSVHCLSRNPFIKRVSDTRRMHIEYDTIRDHFEPSGYSGRCGCGWHEENVNSNKQRKSIPCNPSQAETDDPSPEEIHENNKNAINVKNEFSTLSQGRETRNPAKVPDNIANGNLEKRRESGSNLRLKRAVGSVGRKIVGKNRSRFSVRGIMIDCDSRFTRLPGKPCHISEPNIPEIAVVDTSN